MLKRIDCLKQTNHKKINIKIAYMHTIKVVGVIYMYSGKNIKTEKCISNTGVS